MHSNEPTKSTKPTQPAETESENYVYILECADGTLYTGWTNHLEERVKTHNAGKGAKYTRGRLPAVLVYSERCGTKSEALIREREIKKMTHKGKEALIRRGNGSE